MKKFNYLFTVLAMVLFGTSSLNAQDANSKWGITVGAHAVDFTSVRGMFDGFFDVDDYSIVPPLSKLSVSRSLGESFVVDLTASVGEIDNSRLRVDDEFFLMAGLGLRYRLSSLWGGKAAWFDPYLRVGGNFLHYDLDGLEISPTMPFQSGGDTGDQNGGLLEQEFSGKTNWFTASGGAGVNFWLTRNFGLNVASDYVVQPSENADYANFFQHTLGATFKFGGTFDKDGDGIEDDEDACPETPGPVENNGCPWEDRDGDGVLDNVDDCPDEAGDPANNGCPWVDTDGDTVLDKDDDCVEVPGPVANNGCPWPDRDGDGVLDKDDKCPDTPGLKSNQGCPEDVDATAGVVEQTLKDLLFELNSDKIRATEMAKIKAAAEIIKKSSGKFSINGHTDSKGRDAYNLSLSKKRAAAVKAALEAEGVSLDKLVSEGFGETQLKCSPEKTEADYQCNRRVEVRAIK